MSIITEGSFPSFYNQTVAAQGRPRTITVVSPIIIGVPANNPQRMDKLPDNSHIYVASYSSNEFQVLDVAGESIIATVGIGSEPVGVNITPDGAKAFITNANDGTVSIVQTSDNSILATPATGARPAGTVFTPDGSKGYVFNDAEATLTIIDVATNAATGSVALPGSASQGVCSPSGAFAYFPIPSANSVVAVDCATDTVVATIAGFDNPFAMTLSADGLDVFVSNWVNDGSVMKLDIDPVSPSYRTIVETVSGLVSPWFSALSLDGSRLYVASSTGTVTVINTATNVVVGVPVTVAQTPQGIVVTASNRLWISDSAGGADALFELDTSKLGLPSSSYSANPNPEDLFCFINNGAASVTLNLPDVTKCEDGKVRRYVRLGDANVTADGQGVMIGGVPTRAIGDQETLAIIAHNGAWWLA